MQILAGMTLVAAVTILATTVTVGSVTKPSIEPNASQLSAIRLDLLPDIIVDKSYLFDWDISTNIEPGRVHLRLANGTANIGDGPLYLWGVEPGNPDGTQDVMQRVFADDSSYYDRLAGEFYYHPDHGHIHFEDWAIYRLREVLDSSGVGDIVAEGSKVSFCILDLGIYDETLPNFDPDGQFFSCGSQIQGLSVGWIDIYSKGLPGQNIDITGVPDGLYWLESEVDPENGVLESNEFNNITRILITIGDAGPITPDTYEPNDNGAEVDSRPAGGPNSPNLGPCNPIRIVSDLNIHESANDDYFKFYSNHTGGSGDFVQIDFQHSLGDLDMTLLDSNLSSVATAQGTSNTELISLNGRPEGWYYVRIYGYNGATNPDYSLTIDPPSNNSPSIITTAPPTGDTSLIHSFETYMVTWTYSDPESDQCWVSVYVNTTAQLDGNELLLSISLFTDADQQFYIINTQYLSLETYYVYCEITDGGSFAGDWSEGTITIVEPPDVESIAGYVTDTSGSPIEGVEIMIVGHTHIDTTNVDGYYSIHSHDPGEYGVSFTHDYYRDTVAESISVLPFQTTALDMTLEFECPYQPGDVDGDLEGPNIGDLVYLVDYMFNSGPPPPLELAANVDGLGALDIADLVYLVDYMFNGGPAPVCP